MSPRNAPVLVAPDTKLASHSMVPRTPASTGRRWTVFGSQDFGAAEQPDRSAESTSTTPTQQMLNPSYQLASPREASSPWPDVILSPHPATAPSRFSEPQHRHGNDFHIEIPHSPVGQPSTAQQPPAEDSANLDPNSADVLGFQNTKPAKAAANEPKARRMPSSRSPPNTTSRVGTFWHIASLSFAANPVRLHREWTGAIDRAALPVPSAPQATASSQVGAIIRCLHRDFNSPSNHGRFVRLETLEEAYASNKKRRRLAYALRRKQSGSGFRNLWDRISNDLFIIGEVAFDRCTPRKLHGHAPWWTLMVIATCLVTFAYMAAQWPSFLVRSSADIACSHELWPQGPKSLWDWLVQWNDCRSFGDDYLIMWGARYGPKMTQGQNAYRWFSSLLLYKDFVQLASNLLLFLTLGVHLERRFGTRRVAILTMVAGVGGNFFSAAFEDLCHVYSSGSGATFGLLILFIADMGFNFEAIRFPILRILAAAILLAVFIAAAVVQGLPARLAVLGGALTAIFPALSLLPQLKSEKFEWWIPYASLFTTFGFLLALPLYVYLKRLPGIHC